MNFLILAITILSSNIYSALAAKCTNGEKLPGTSNGCYNSGSYVCQCATGVQMVCSQTGVSLGLTSTWRKGSNVFTMCKNGTPPPKYTAIATFLGSISDPYNGSVRHAAIFLSCGASGSIVVMDQYTGKSWGRSTIYDKGTVTTTSYNSRLYHVITK
jgi:hypothetical protein